MLTALLALIVAVIGMTSGGLVLSGPASAATPGITTTLLINGQPATGTPTVKSGDVEHLQVQYDNSVTPGSTVKIKLGDNVTVGTLPAANTAVQSITKEPDGTVDITFKNPWPAGVNQGIVDLTFTVNPVATSGQQDITWNVDGTANTQSVTVLRPGDSTAPTADAQSKGESGNYNGAVTVDADGTVHLNPNVIGKPMTYTVKGTTTTGGAYAISDQLPAGLTYVTGSASASVDTWDADGVNRTTTDPFTDFTPALTPAGTTFSTTANLPTGRASTVTITYQAAIPDDAARTDLEQQLQAEYDGVGAAGGNFTVALTNTATIGGVTRTATVNLTGTKAGPWGPVPGNAFDKTVDVTSQNVTPAGDGTLTPPVPVVYTLTANLSQWGAPEATPLSQNVVITDTLPAQASWATGAGLLTPTGITLTQAGACPSAADFAADTYLDQYCVDGQTLLINVGKSSTTVASIAAKAMITTVTGLPTGTPPFQGAMLYNATNTAGFDYGATPYTKSVTTGLIDRGVTGPDGYNDPSVFAKTTSPSSITVQPGQSTTVNYTFTVNATNDDVVDAADSKIVDKVDPNVFGTVSAATLGAAVTGTYGSTNLVSSDFAVTVDASNNVTIMLSAAGKAKATPVNQNWSVHLPLDTVPVVGTQTVPVDNSATIYNSADNTPLYNSTVSSQVSSYGDEAEVRKTVWDSDLSDWTSNLRAKLNADGTLVKDDFVYRVQFIPHGNYDNVVIVPVDDVLPAGTSFVGFVTEANAGTGADPTAGPVDVGGNIQATYDPATRTVALTQADGTRLDASQTIAAFFEVHVDDFTADVPIVNTIGATSATITPTDGYPLSIAKQDSGDPGTVIDDPNARFQLKDADGTVVVDDIFVSDGFLRVAGPDGQPAAVKVSRPGTYTLSEVLPPAGYVKSDATLQFVVTADSIPDQQTFFDDPVGPSVSVGDYVWVDTNRDGRQNTGEPGIPGVVLTITGPDGRPVTGVNGLPVGPQSTDEDGKYSFDGLPVLTDGQHYTVTIDQDASKTALAPYTPTKAGVGDRAGDSSTWTAQSEGLTEDGQRDPTLDFGFVTKTYAIGDKVWIDTNNNGIQDSGEPPLAGVTVTLLDGSGNTVATTTTDADGRYIFDNLPAGTYQVKFRLTADQAAKYTFTTTGSGTVGTDSNADQDTGLTRTFTLGDSDADLTTSYTDQTVEASEGIDPTWDAGVVLLDTGSTSLSSSPHTSPSSIPSSIPSTDGGSGTSPDDSGSGGGGLAMTGSDIAGMSIAALAALVGGTGLLLLGRARRRRAH